MDAIYTPQNTSPAYQLRWSLALFTTTDLPSKDIWFNTLQQAVALDNIHLLQHKQAGANVHLSLIRTKTRDMILRSAQAKSQRFPRLSLFVDHLHLTLGCNHGESSQQVVLCYVNNLAYAHGMKAVLQFSYYVGTFGEYSMSAVRNDSVPPR